MKKSAKVKLAFLSSFAPIALTACNDGGDWAEARRCVDKNNVVVEDRLCSDTGSGGGHGGSYRHYYGGRGYYPGETAYGGGNDPRPGVRYESPSRIPRGGFGSTGRAFVGGSHLGG